MSSEKVCLIRKCWHKSQVLCVKSRKKKKSLTWNRWEAQTKLDIVELLFSSIVPFVERGKRFLLRRELCWPKKRTIFVWKWILWMKRNRERGCLLCARHFAALFLKLFPRTPFRTAQIFMFCEGNLYMLPQKRLRSIIDYQTFLLCVCFRTRTFTETTLTSPVRFQEQLLKIT